MGVSETEVPAGCGLAGLGTLRVVVVVMGLIVYETGELVEAPEA